MLDKLWEITGSRVLCTVLLHVWKTIYSKLPRSANTCSHFLLENARWTKIYYIRLQNWNYKTYDGVQDATVPFYITTSYFTSICH
jgi:hypothetical protein